MVKYVTHLHSTVEIQLEDLEALLEDLTLPEGICDLSIDRSENIYAIKSESECEDIGKYTPTANLKATLEDKKPKGEEKPSEGLWSNQMEKDDEEEFVEPVTYAGFKGYGEGVLYNKALQYPMFEILCEIALNAESGFLTAIVCEEGELQPVRIVNGEKREAEIKVVDSEDLKEADWKRELEATEVD